MLESLAACQLAITGLVQGVGYRFSMQQQAQRFGVVGWVRNTSDGRVEALVQGTPLDIERMLAWCRHGPPQARVDAVTQTAQPVDDKLSDFDCLPTR